MVSREDMRESLAVQEWLEEGRAEGWAEGRRRTAEHLLRVALTRFEHLALPDPIPDSVDVAALAMEVVAATGEAAVRRALVRHLE